MAENDINPINPLEIHGNIEVEEGDLRGRYANCERNHENFIPINQFTTEHLPEDHRDNDLYDLIKVKARLTVRIDVKKVSPRRPQFWPNTGVPYPYYDKRGNVNKRYGSGEITVCRFEDGQEFNANGTSNDYLTRENIRGKYTTCTCDRCSDNPSNIWWEIYVHTAMYLVFDEIEASQTSCRLFYDSADSQWVKLDKFSLDHTNRETDYCVMKYITCDVIGQTLYDINARLLDLKRKVWEKYWNKSDVIFTVSHPHGYFKQVSVGHMQRNYKLREYTESINITKLTYTAGTCLGSSGAMVFCVGSRNNHFHAGSLEFGLNYSSFGAFWRENVH